MYKKTLMSMVIDVLNKNSGKALTNSEIAEKIAENEKEYVEYKIKNYKGNSEFDHIATIQAQVATLRNRCNNDNKKKEELSENGIELVTSNKWLASETISKTTIDEIDKSVADIEKEVEEEVKKDETIEIEAKNNEDTEEIKRGYEEKEKTLYNKFIKFIEVTERVHAMRINEKSVTGTRGKRGDNKWLYPDVVGYKVNFDGDELDDNLTEIAHKFTNRAESILLCSYELKWGINNISSARKALFQALANSSWANYAYLVVPKTDIKDSSKGITDDDAKKELNMLMSLHGVGLIEIKSTYCEIITEARKRDVDWYSIDRIYQKNKDFVEFMKSVKKAKNAI